MTEFLSVFDVAASEDTSHYANAREASVRASLRAKDQFGKFLASSNGIDEYAARWDLMLPDFAHLAAEVADQYQVPVEDIVRDASNELISSTYKTAQIKETFLGPLLNGIGNALGGIFGGGGGQLNDMMKNVGGPIAGTPQQNQTAQNFWSQQPSGPSATPNLTQPPDPSKPTTGPLGNNPNPLEMSIKGSSVKEAFLGDLLHGSISDFVKEARRPKLCPYHRNVVDIGLQSGDPGRGYEAMSGQAFGPHHCESGEWEGGHCKFRPEMTTQSYWDDRDQRLQENRELRQQQQQQLQHEQPQEPIGEEPEAIPETEVEESVGEEPNITEELQDAPSAVGDMSLAASTKDAGFLDNMVNQVPQAQKALGLGGGKPNPQPAQGPVNQAINQAAGLAGGHPAQGQQQSGGVPEGANPFANNPAPFGAHVPAAQNEGPAAQMPPGKVVNTPAGQGQWQGMPLPQAAPGQNVPGQPVPGSPQQLQQQGLPNGVNPQSILGSEHEAAVLDPTQAQQPQGPQVNGGGQSAQVTFPNLGQQPQQQQQQHQLPVVNPSQEPGSPGEQGQTTSPLIPTAGVIKEAPGNQHLPGASPKRNRQYEHIKEKYIDDGMSEEEAKELAARTVNKQRSEHGETKSNVHEANFVQQRGNKWVIVSENGKVSGIYDTQDEASQALKGNFGWQGLSDDPSKWPVEGSAHIAEALETQDIKGAPATGYNGIGNKPSPKIDTDRWTPESVPHNETEQSEISGTPHPTEHQDPVAAPQYTDAWASNEEDGRFEHTYNDAMKHNEDINKETPVNREEGPWTWSGPQRSAVTPETLSSVTADTHKNPLQEIHENQQELTVDAVTAAIAAYEEE